MLVETKARIGVFAIALGAFAGMAETSQMTLF